MKRKKEKFTYQTLLGTKSYILTQFKKIAAKKKNNTTKQSKRSSQCLTRLLKQFGLYLSRLSFKPRRIVQIALNINFTLFRA